MPFLRVEIQPDFLEVVNNSLKDATREKIWLRVDDVSYSVLIGPGKVYRCEKEGVYLVRESAQRFNLHVGGGTVALRAPKSYLMASKSNFTAIDLAGDRFVLGDDCGNLSCLTRKGIELTPRFTKEAHYGDILALQSFPSGKVALTMGLDYTCKVWSLEDGNCPRVLKGQQTMRLTSFAMIGQGRNFVCGSLDGSVCVWECGSGQCVERVRRVRDSKDGVLSLSVKAGEEVESKPPFYECSGKMYVGHKSGVVTVWGLDGWTFLEEVKVGESGVSAIGILDDLVVVGFEDVPLVRAFRGSEKVWEVKIGEEGGVVKIVGQGDKVVVLTTYDLVSFKKDGTVDEYFVGCDSSVSDVVVKNGVWVCGKYGMIVEY